MRTKGRDASRTSGGRFPTSRPYVLYLLLFVLNGGCRLNRHGRHLRPLGENYKNRAMIPSC